MAYISLELKSGDNIARDRRKGETMKRSSSRILTSHVGSLVRPPEIVKLLQAKPDGVPFTLDQRDILQRHISEAVREQADCAIDVPSDGEYSKAGFAGYVTDRLS